MSIDQLSSTFAAIADPTRRAILVRLSRGDAAVKELAEPFRMTLPAITKHLKVLEKAGLIERTRSAQKRPCKLRAKPLQEAASWIDNYRRFWEASFDRLDQYLNEMQSSMDQPPTSTTTRKKKTSR
ncbi:MAG: winged helix-turn-helix transcriptional regulator [Planctomyces sp.]|nr:winged helix-turn-helix transcriptional regulator [Planctomyces sp.]